ncbi:non-homologous end-joining DNA ligase [Desulfolucanica intricata]|uniref:non-homologous end-joining DNA ligase n=1 Tax=Desulfolucanica intricata TaxID=1285191 RepID=UPI00082B6D89|nr:non-homologous end-joining DNA ligase [Desulfolucanica intricata]
MKEIPITKPMLAVSREPFDSEDYLYEIKWDGYRGMVYLKNGNVNIRSRNLLDLTGIFPELSNLSEKVRKCPVLLDGEIIVLRDGRPSFAALQARGRMESGLKIQQAARHSPALFVAFDLLYMDGLSVMDRPLKERKDLLSEIVNPGENLIVSEYILKAGKQFAAACASQGLEGAVAKRLDSPYLPGKRSSFWAKFRYIREADLIICGYQAGHGERNLRSLVLGGYRLGKLIYQGKVGTGFSNQESKQLLAVLKELKVSDPVLDLPREEIDKTYWVRPCLVCVVNYLTVTADGRLRHPSFKGLRTDKSPENCQALS